MFPAPGGAEPTAEQILELDTEYLAGGAPRYFSDRIDSLVAWHDAPAGPDYSTGLGAEVAKALGQDPRGPVRSEERERRAQVTIDAFALRQHLAETLMRFLEARCELAGAEPGTRSLWFTIATGPTRTLDVVQAVAAASHREAPNPLVRSMIPPQVLAQAPLEQAESMMRATVAWIQHAVELLTRTDLPLSAGSNKAKHGMALRHADDISLRLLGPDTDPERITESQVQGRTRQSIPIIERPVLQILDVRPGRSPRKTHDADLLWIQLDVAAILAEATALNLILQNAFHVAAAELHERTGGPEEFPGYVDPRVLPPPRYVQRDHEVLGLRLPVTGNPRDTVLVFRDVGQTRNLDLGAPRRSMIVADDPAPEADPTAVRT